MATLTFDAGTIPDDLVWGGTTDTPGTVIDRADATAGTTKALQFPDIGDSEETYFELAAFAGPGADTFTVRYEVSSEGGYDYFRIYIDDVEVWEEAGTGAGWSEYSTTLTPGFHMLRLRYSKDSSADEGEDTAWISQITYPPGERPSIAAETLDPLTSYGVGETPVVPGWRYWRMVSLATQSISGSTGLGEVELRATAGGADLTGPGIGTASQTDGVVNGSYPASNAFDNDLGTGWQAWSSSATLRYVFTGQPVEVAQISVKQVLRGEMLDIEVQRSKDGATWETAAIKRGSLTWPNSGLPPTYFTPGTETLINLSGTTRDYQGKIGVNSFWRTDRSVEFCPVDRVAITGYSIPHPVVIDRLIAYSRAPMPSPPIGATTYTFAIKGVIYASNVSNVPETLIAVTQERTSVPNDWFELFLDEPVVLAPGFYHFGVHVGGTSGGLYSCDTSGGAVSVKTLNSHPYADGPPATWPYLQMVQQSQPHPIYAIYPVNLGYPTLEPTVSAGVGVVGEGEPEPVTGTASLTLADLASTASGTASGPVNQIRQRVTLMGSQRPTKSLHATWVPR